MLKINIFKYSLSQIMSKFFICFVCAATTVYGEDLLSNITTIPSLSSNKFASGLEKLELTVNSSQSLISCYWNVSTHKLYELIPIFNRFNKCPNQYCIVTGNYRVFNLNITDPIPNRLSVSLSCGRPLVLQNYIKSWLWQSKDCENVTSQHVGIKFSGSARYNTPGTFSCLPNGSVRYLNNSLPTDLTTSCLANAIWDKEELFQCWQAPINVALFGNLEIVEGNSATFECNYTDVNPKGNKSAFFYGSNQTIVKKGESLSIGNVSRNLNKKTIFCQAITPYTVTNSFGRSSNRTLTVFYMVSFKLESVCNWSVGIKQSCNIFVDSNPQSSVVSIEKNGVEISSSVDSFYWEMNSNQLSLSKNKVLHNDSGNYTITVFTPTFNKSSTFSFHIYTNGTTSIPVLPPVNLYAIIGGSAGGVLLLFLILIIVIVRIKAKKSEQILLNDLYGDTGGNGNNADSPVGIEQVIYEEGQFNEKTSDNGPEEKENELYASNAVEENVYALAVETGGQTNGRNKIAEENQVSSAEEPACSVSASTGPNPDIEALYTCVNKVRSDRAKNSADKVET